MTGKGMGSVGLVRLAGQGVQVVLTAATIAVLARLLDPADFGLLALAGAWLGFLGVLRDFGMPLAVVQQRDASAGTLRRLFRHLLRLQGALAVTALAAAPAVAWMYDEPRLMAVLWWLAAAVLVLGTAALPRAVLVRRMRFGVLATVEAAGVLLGAVAAIWSALEGAGYWALVVFQGARAVTTAALLWGSARWRPGAGSFEEEAEDLTAPRAFGRRLTWARVVRQAGRQIDRMLLGFFVGPATLGFYQQAHRWSTLPLQQAQAPLLDVTVSVLSRLRDRPDALRETFLQASRVSLALVLPALAYLVADAPTVVRVVLGPGWDETVPLLRLLAAASFAAAFAHPFKWWFLTLGRTREHLRTQLVLAAVTTVTVAVAAPQGVTAVAWALLAVAVLVTPWIGRQALGGTPVEGRAWLGAALLPAAAAVGAAVAVYAVARLAAVQALSPWERLPLHLVVYGLVYPALLTLSGGSPARLWRALQDKVAPPG